MRLLILSWLLVAASIAGCITYDNRTSTPPPPDPFKMVCEYLENECDFDAPIIVESRMIQYIGFGGVLGGTIGGEKYVFVDPDGPHLWKTILHEIVHYVAWNGGITVEQCESEELARNVASALTNTEVDERWWENYGCERS